MSLIGVETSHPVYSLSGVKNIEKLPKFSDFGTVEELTVKIGPYSGLILLDDPFDIKRRKVLLLMR